MKEITYNYDGGDLPEILALAFIDSLLDRLIAFADSNPDLEDDILNIIRDSFEDFDIEYDISEV